MSCLINLQKFVDLLKIFQLNAYIFHTLAVRTVKYFFTMSLVNILKIAEGKFASS